MPLAWLRHCNYVANFTQLQQIIIFNYYHLLIIITSKVESSLLSFADNATTSNIFIDNTIS